MGKRQRLLLIGAFRIADNKFFAPLRRLKLLANTFLPKNVDFFLQNSILLFHLLVVHQPHLLLHHFIDKYVASVGNNDFHETGSLPGQLPDPPVHSIEDDNALLVQGVGSGLVLGERCEGVDRGVVGG